MPELLYHYTNQAGLLGILASGTLWATRIHYLNDSEEFWHAFRVTDEELGRRLASEKEANELKKLNALREEMQSLLGVGLVVCSLSERPDSLSQWRGYVGNESGFALGFDYGRLGDLAQKADFDLQACIYDAAEQRRLAAQLVDEVMATDFETEGSYVDPAHPRTIFIQPRGGDFMKRLEKMAPRFKHVAFEDEREWRLVSRTGIPSKKVKFRPGRSMLTPYYEFSLLDADKLSCLRKIVVGPTPHPELARRAVEQLVTKMALDPAPEVISSSVPFRYW